MKHTAKHYFAFGITTAFLISGISGVIPAKADALSDLLGGAAAETVVAQELQVSGLTALPGDKKASLMWTPVTVDDAIITKYEISYGKLSVEESMADTYDNVLKVDLDADTLETVGVAKTDITNLKNGEKIFFSVKAISTDNTKGSASAEVFTTPSATQTAAKTESNTDTNTDTATIFKLDEAKSLTTTIIKATLSKDIVLPEDEKILKSSFVVNIKNDTDTILEIQDIVLRDNYYLAKSEEEVQKVDSDNEVYIILKDSVTLEKDYQVTVSARVKDTQGNAIENGVVDNLFFAGTDSTDIPVEEMGKYAPEIGEETPPAPKQEVSTDTKAETEKIEEPLKGAAGLEEKDEVKEKTLIKSGPDDEILKNAPNDTTPPEDVTNLKSSLRKRVKDFVVSLSWTGSKNTAGDLIKQLLYISIDGGKTWGKAKELNKSIEDYVFSGTPEKQYVVKLSTKDRVGNESKGVIKTINIPQLASTGAPIFLALGLAMMGGGALSLRRREEA